MEVAERQGDKKVASLPPDASHILEVLRSAGTQTVSALDPESVKADCACAGKYTDSHLTLQNRDSHKDPIEN